MKGWRTWSLAAWYCVSLVGFVFLGCTETDRSQPDVILVTLDTTRADHLGAYGYARDTSPSIDAFANDAVTFQRAWASGAWTLPTHASILTGRHVTNHGARFDLTAPNVSLSQVLEGDFFARHKANRLSDEEVTLAERLAARGYATAAFAGGPWLAPPFGLMQGYGTVDESPLPSVGGRTAEDLTNRSIEWLEARPAEEPIHLLVNYFDPHSPWDPPPGFDHYPGVAIPLDPEQDPIFVNGGAKLTKEQRTAAVDRYDGEIRYMDHHFGRLMDALRRLGRFDDALIVVVADHGELFGEHGVMGHGRWLYEPVIRVPLIVRLPGGRDAGRMESRPFSQVDLLPLIADEVGLDLREKIDGVPIGARKLVLAEAYRDPFSVSHFGKRYDRDLSALVQWPWKIIRSDRGELEIFDLLRDRGERFNRRNSPARRQIEELLDLELAGLEPRTESTPPGEVSPELQEGLRQLGYIE